MSAEPVGSSRSFDFREASPKEVRASLVPEEQSDFDRQWRTALNEAAESLDLAGVFRVLDSWRRRAAVTTYLGHGGYRQMLARAELASRTGEPPPGSVSWSDLKVELGL